MSFNIIIEFILHIIYGSFIKVMGLTIFTVITELGIESLQVQTLLELLVIDLKGSERPFCELFN